MSKINNLQEVAAMVATLLDETEYDIVEKIGLESTIWAVTGIYITNDLVSGYGQDFIIPVGDISPYEPYKISLISYRRGVSVIIDKKASKYQDNFPLCGYEDLHDDIYQILISIQAAIDRINA